MVPDEIRRLVSNDQSLLESVAERVQDILLSLSRDTGFGYAPRPTPIKAIESIATKLESGRYARWVDLDDLIASSIIIPTKTAEPTVIEYLEENFRKECIRTGVSTVQNPAEFRFGATRFIGRLKTVVPGNSSLSSILFEIQVRTAFEHAWSVTTHALSYKSDRIDWRFNRLAAQLKATVEQLDMLVNAYEQNAELLTPQAYAEIDEQKRIVELFSPLLESGLIPKESAPYRLSLFAKNIRTLLRKCRGPLHSIGSADRSERLVSICRRELETNGWSRSLSLHQFSLGVLLESELVTGFESTYFALITPALEERFPKSAVIKLDSRCILHCRPAE